MLHQRHQRGGDEQSKFYLTSRLGELRHWKPKPSKDEPPDLPGYDEEFSQLRIAKAWRLTPYQWRQQSVDDRAMMMAFEMFESIRESRRAEYRDDKRAQEDKKKQPGQSDYERLQQMLKNR